MKVTQSGTAWKPRSNVIQEDLQPYEISERYGNQKYSKYTINYDCSNVAVETNFNILLMTHWHKNRDLIVDRIIKKMMGIIA